MKKVKLKANAKINFTLDVGRAENGFHPIKSLVSSIDVCDEITLTARADDKVTLTEKGVPSGCEKEKNNAYKTAVAYVEKFGTNGVDITLKKRIPVGGGLGGSSADIAGVINGMQLLYGAQDKAHEISDNLASDATYMLTGGYAVISGRGNTVMPLSVDKTFYLLLITNPGQITAKQGYQGFDEIGKDYPFVTDLAVEKFLSGRTGEFIGLLGNGLYESALKVIPELEVDVSALKTAGADTALLTGSGSVVYGVFESEKKRDECYKKLKKKYGKRLIKCKTVK